MRNRKAKTDINSRAICFDKRAALGVVFKNSKITGTYKHVLSIPNKNIPSPLDDLQERLNLVVSGRVDKSDSYAIGIH